MKNKFYLLLLLSLLGLGASACLFQKNPASSENDTSSNSAANQSQNNASSASNASTETGLKMQDEIRKVDFKNFTYEASCAGEDKTKITVKKGEFSQEKGDDKIYFNVMNVSYGDVNADQSEDAIILTVCNTGGTGQFSEGFIYEMKNGKPALLATIPGGDRADGGLRSAKVEGGLIIIETNDPGETGGACCPEFVITTKYRLKGKELEKVGAESKRELYPAERVKFEKGATKTTLTINFKKDDDIKRFVVGARAGQSLIITSSSKDVSLSLEGEADTIEGPNSLTARLQKSGDFKIQVQKISEVAVTLNLTIEIQ